MPKGCFSLDTEKRIALIEILFWSEHFYSMGVRGKKNQAYIISNNGINNTNFSRMILIYFSLQSLGHLVKNLVPEQKLNGKKVGNSYSNGKLGQGKKRS